MPATLAEIVRRLKDRPPPSPEDVARIRAALAGVVPGVLDRIVRAFVPRTASDLVDEWFPWTRDQRLATDPSVPDEERMAALARLVANIRWGPNSRWGDRERRAWRELRARADAEERPVAQIKRELLAEAVLLVLADRDRFRRLRVGRGQGSFYLTEGDDQPLEIRPEVLPYGEPGTSGAPAPFAESPYLHWFAREVQAAATAILLDEPYPPTDATEDDAWERPHRPLADGAAPDEEVASDPLLVLLASELRGEVGRQLRAVLERASPRQRQLLELMAYGATAAEAARALGIAEATARVQLKRLRDKAM